ATAHRSARHTAAQGTWARGREGENLMLRDRVAILAETLLLLNCHSMSGGATGALPDQQRHRRHVPHHGCTPPRAQDFGSRYPQTGRFEARHKRGLVLDDKPAGEEWEEVDRECWSATIAAIVASGSTLALQRTLKPDEQSPSAEGYGRQQRHNRRRRRRRHRYHRKDRDNSSAPRFRRMRAELSANLDAWRMRRRRARETTPAAAIVIRQHLSQLTAQLSEFTGEGFRRAERLLSAANASGNVGIRIAGCAELLRRRGRELFLLGLRKKQNPDGSSGERKLGKGKEGEAERRKMRELQLLTDKIVQNVVDVVARDGWEVVVEREGVVVHRQYLALGPDGTPEEPAAPAAPAHAAGVPKAEASSAFVGGRVEGSADDPTPVGEDSGQSRPPRFACVKASAILSVPPEVVYLLFADNSRVGEYNEHCREVKDLEVLSQDSKITWAASGRMGPFKARDFCTLVHFRTLSDGTLAQVSKPVEHPAAPRTSRYVRSEILLAGNFMRPVPGDPSRTEFLMVTHVNPGGAAETRAGAMLVNSLCTSSPVTFIRRLEVAAKKLMLELQQQQKRAPHGAVAKEREAGREGGGGLEGERGVGRLEGEGWGGKTAAAAAAAATVATPDDDAALRPQPEMPPSPPAPPP
ncbi:unnamed protein product, partial [Ectocarpus sp. 4 AP-2014]